ncbi:hypothetical protein BGX20_003718, partial [Mortierella sp. AD010]
MNPIPHNLRHLEALFDHYNVDAKGHFLGESSSFCLNCQPALPLLPSTTTPVDVNASTTAVTVTVTVASPTPTTATSDVVNVEDASNPISLAATPTSMIGSGARRLSSITAQEQIDITARRGQQRATANVFTLNSSSHDGNMHSMQSISDESNPLPRAHSTPGRILGPDVSSFSATPSAAAAVPPSSSSTSSSHSNPTAYRDPEFPVVAQSTAVLSQFPKPRLARELIELFLSKINRFMPIVPTLFLEEYDTGVPQSPLLLLAIFSIASKYSSDPMCRSDPSRSQTAGENYCKTACRLVDEFLDCPRLSTVQALFFLGKHLEESKNQTFFTKSFMYVGMAVRMAMDMGLNRDCSGWGLDPIMVEYRNRTWWYLYVYDRAQGSCYGRPYLIQDQDCGAEKPKPDPWSRNPEQDMVDVEHQLQLIHIFKILGRVMSNFYPTNTSDSNFYCNVRGTCNIDLVGKGLVADPGLSEPSFSTVQGSRKRSKTANKSKPKSCDLDGNQDSLAGSENSIRGPGLIASTVNGPQGHQEMLARQQTANQKQDAIVAELDKDLTEWVQALPTHLQWTTLEIQPNIYGDVLHGVYYAILILLHRPSIRVGEFLPSSPNSEQSKYHPASDPSRSKEGCHSMAVCAQAASRITKLAERCQNLTQLERFGAGAFILLQAARIHLMIAAVPTPPRQSMTGFNGDGPSGEFIEAIRRKENAVDQFHRSLGSLRKFSIYHWNVDGIGLSIRSLERTLAAILQEQELDHEQEMERQRQKLLEYDATFFDQDYDTNMTNPTGPINNTAAVALDGSTSSENKPDGESMHERAYYESMRLLELRLLYRERHRYTKDNHLEQHLQRQDSKSGMDLVHRRGLLDVAAPDMSYRSVLNHNISDLFDKSVPQSGRPDGTITSAGTTPTISTASVPGLVIRTYKPNTSGKVKRRGGSNAGSSSASHQRSRSGTIQSKGPDDNLKVTSLTPDDSTPQDDIETRAVKNDPPILDAKGLMPIAVPDMMRSMSGLSNYSVTNVWPGSGMELNIVPGTQTHQQQQQQQQQQQESSSTLLHSQQFNNVVVTPTDSFMSSPSPSNRSAVGPGTNVTNYVQGQSMYISNQTSQQQQQHHHHQQQQQPQPQLQPQPQSQQQQQSQQQPFQFQSQHYHYRQQLLQQQQLQAASLEQSSQQPQQSYHEERKQLQARQLFVSPDSQVLQLNQSRPQQVHSGHQQQSQLQQPAGLQGNNFATATLEACQARPEILIVHEDDADASLHRSPLMAHGQQPQQIQSLVKQQQQQQQQQQQRQEFNRVTSIQLTPTFTQQQQQQQHQQQQQNYLMQHQQQAQLLHQRLQQHAHQTSYQQDQHQQRMFMQQMSQPTTGTQPYLQQHQQQQPFVQVQDASQGISQSGFGIRNSTT